MPNDISLVPNFPVDENFTVEWLEHVIENQLTCECCRNKYPETDNHPKYCQACIDDWSVIECSECQQYEIEGDTYQVEDSTLCEDCFNKLVDSWNIKKCLCCFEYKYCDSNDLLYWVYEWVRWVVCESCTSRYDLLSCDNCDHIGGDITYCDATDDYRCNDCWVNEDNDFLFPYDATWEISSISSSDIVSYDMEKRILPPHVKGHLSSFYSNTYVDITGNYYTIPFLDRKEWIWHVELVNDTEYKNMVNSLHDWYKNALNMSLYRNLKFEGQFAEYDCIQPDWSYRKRSEKIIWFISKIEKLITKPDAVEQNMFDDTFLVWIKIKKIKELTKAVTDYVSKFWYGKVTKYFYKISADPEFKMMVMKKQQANFPSCQVKWNVKDYAQWYHDMYNNWCNFLLWVFEDESCNTLVGRQLIRFFLMNGKELDTSIPVFYLDRSYWTGEFANHKNKLCLAAVTNSIGKEYPLAISNSSRHESFSWAEHFQTYSAAVGCKRIDYTPLDNLRQPLRWMDHWCAYYRDTSTNTYGNSNKTKCYDYVSKSRFFLASNSTSTNDKLLRTISERNWTSSVHSSELSWWEISTTTDSK